MKDLKEKVNALPARRRKKIKARAEELIAEPVTEGSGNVFADLGLPGADHELLKAKQKIGSHRQTGKRLSVADGLGTLGIGYPRII